MPDRSNLPGPARAGLILVLVIVTLAVYSGALWGDYLYDDGRLIVGNPRVQSITAALSAWHDPLWSFANPAATTQTGYWRPLTVVALALGQWISQGEALGIHILSILLHLACTFAVARVAQRILRHELWAWCVALLFSLHPAHVQSVAWASAINDPLYGLLSMLSLGAFLAWRERDRSGIPALAALWFMLALLAKEQALVVFPIALALDSLLPTAESAPKGPNRLLRPALTLGAPLALWLVLRMTVFGGVKAGFQGAIVEFGLDASRMLLLSFEILGGLLGLILAPRELPFFRGVQPNLGWTDAAALLSLVWIAVVLGAGLLAWRVQARAVLAGLGLLLIPLVPHAVLPESTGAYPVADRFAYLAIFGAGLAAIGCLRRLPRGLGVIPVALIATYFGFRSVERVGQYSDEETFFRTAVDESPDVPAVYWSLGRLQLDRYKRDQRKENLDEALYRYLQCLMLGHDYGTAGPKLPPSAPLTDRLQELGKIIHGWRKKPVPDLSVMVSVDDRLQANLGQAWCLLFAGQLPPEYDLDTPLQIFQQVAAGFPNDTRAVTGLGTAHLVRGELDEAKRELSRAVDLNPANAEAWFNLGETLSRLRDFNGARGAYQQSLRMRPGSIRDRVSIVEAALDGGQLQVAKQSITELRNITGNGPEVHYLEGMLAAKQGRWVEGLVKFDAVVAAEPKNGLAQLQRAKVLVQLNRIAEAVEAFGIACERLTSNFEAHYNLAALLSNDPNTYEQATPYLQRAYQLGQPGKQRMVLQAEIASRLGENANNIWPLLNFDRRRRDHAATLGWVERLLALEKPWDGFPDRDKRIAEVHLAGATALDELGETERSVAGFRRALEWNPDSFWAWHHLASSYQRLNQPTPCLEAATQALDRSDQVAADLRETVKTHLAGLKRWSETQINEFVGPVLPMEERKDIPGAPSTKQ